MRASNSSPMTTRVPIHVICMMQAIPARALNGRAVHRGVSPLRGSKGHAGGSRADAKDSVS